MLQRKFLSSPSRFNILYSKLSQKKHILPTITQSALYSNRLTIEKSAVDPRVKKLQDKIIFSEYIEDKQLKLPYEIAKKIQNSRNILKKKEILYDHLTTPAISVALKYLNVAQPVTDFDLKTKEEKNEKEEETNESPAVKPIYMPYGVQDKVEMTGNLDEEESKMAVEDEDDLNENLEDEEEEEERNTLNEKYQVEYNERMAKMEDKMYTRWRDDINTIPAEWALDYGVENESELSDTNRDPWVMKYGTPDPNSKITSTPCSGCGALLHCKDPAIPGYVPSELFIYKKKKELRKFICQRCHFMKYYNVALDVKVSADEYPKLLAQIKKDKVKVVVLMVDLMDFPCCIWPDLQNIIGTKVPILLVGNKVDLMPQDGRQFFKNIKERLMDAVVDAGINRRNIVDIVLISAKSHFGVENLITSLFNITRKGNVYLVGCTNVGKSSLFNALIQSDYCKVKAVDLVKRATVAPWPGTTLNLLKFPITRGSQEHIKIRTQRLLAERMDRKLEQDHLKQMYQNTGNIQFATLQSRIGTSFIKKGIDSVKKGRVTDIFSMTKEEDKMVEEEELGLDENSFDFRTGNWCFDTPGTVQYEQILHLLTTEELLHTLPSQMIEPRTFVLHRNETLFLAGLGRIDILESSGILRVTVFASKKLPVTICLTKDADSLYEELLKTEAFVVPVPDEERLKLWPKMEGRYMSMIGVDRRESVADVLLSSAGWVAITPEANEKVDLKAWTPEGRGLYLRQPALLRHSVYFRGDRVQKTPAYKRTKIIFSNT